MIEEFVLPRKVLSRGRRGFSIIAVLVLSIVALTVAGVTMSLLENSSGAGRTATSSAAAYNYLQESVEEGKALLRKSMDNTNPPPKYTDKPGYNDGTLINAPDMLLLSDAPTAGYPLGHAINRNLNQAALRSKGLGGSSGNLLVRIYDMQYRPDNVKIDPANAVDLSLLPPSLKINGSGSWGHALVNATDPDAPPPNENNGPSGDASNAGVYMVRATLTVNGESGPKRWMLESAVIQSNNEI